MTATARSRPMKRTARVERTGRWVDRYRVVFHDGWGMDTEQLCLTRWGARRAARRFVNPPDLGLPEVYEEQQ